jgi:hypothetical protein
MALEVAGVRPIRRQRIVLLIVGSYLLSYYRGVVVLDEKRVR